MYTLKFSIWEAILIKEFGFIIESSFNWECNFYSKNIIFKRTGLDMLRLRIIHIVSKLLNRNIPVLGSLPWHLLTAAEYNRWQTQCSWHLLSLIWVLIVYLCLHLLCILLWQNSILALQHDMKDCLGSNHRYGCLLANDCSPES